jgi:HSP20 family protein
MFTTIRRQNPFYPVLSDVFADRFLNDSDWNSSPAVNIIENKDGFRIELAAPGLEKSDFHIHVEKRTLEVSSEKEQTAVEGDRFHRKEFSYNQFKRSFALPVYADTDNIRANYENGILTVWVPKREEAKEKPARVIDIA